MYGLEIWQLFAAIHRSTLAPIFFKLWKIHFDFQIYFTAFKFWWRSKIFYTIFHQDVPPNDIRIKSVLLIKIWQSISETKGWHNKILSPEKYTSKPGTNPICRHLCAQSFSVGPYTFPKHLTTLHMHEKLDLSANFKLCNQIKTCR